MQPTLTISDLVELPVRLMQGDPLLPYWDVIYPAASSLAVIGAIVVAFCCLGMAAKKMLLVLSLTTGAIFAGHKLLATGLPDAWLQANGKDAARVRHLMTGRPVAPDELTRTDVLKSVQWLEAERKEIEAARRRLALAGAAPEQVDQAVEQMLLGRRRNR